MQPPQADQPEGGSGSGGQLSSKFGNSSGQSWATMTIAASIFIAVVIVLLAVAPITKYIKCPPLPPQHNMSTSQSGPMRLVGKSHFHTSLIYFFLFYFSYFRCPVLLPFRNLQKSQKLGNKGQPPLGSREQMMRSLEDQGEIPLIVIVSVSVCGTILLLLNIVLISCFVHKKRQQKLLKDKESGSETSGSNVQKATPPSEGRFHILQKSFTMVMHLLTITNKTSKSRISLSYK